MLSKTVWRVWRKWTGQWPWYRRVHERCPQLWRRVRRQFAEEDSGNCDHEAPSPSSQVTTTAATPSTSHQVPSPGYCATDYEPLSNLAGNRSPNTSPPRKRRRLQGRTGKIMKVGLFQGNTMNPNLRDRPARPGAQQTQTLLPDLWDEHLDLFKRFPGDSSTLPVRISLSQRSALEIRVSEKERQGHWPRSPWSQREERSGAYASRTWEVEANFHEGFLSRNRMQLSFLWWVHGWAWFRGKSRGNQTMRAEFHGRPLRSSLWGLACPRVLVVPNWHRDQSPGFVLSLRLGFQHTNCKYYWSLVLKV